MTEWAKRIVKVLATWHTAILPAWKDRDDGWHTWLRPPQDTAEYPTCTSTTNFCPFLLVTFLFKWEFTGETRQQRRRLDPVTSAAVMEDGQPTAGPIPDWPVTKINFNQNNITHLNPDEISSQEQHFASHEHNEIEYWILVVPSSNAWALHFLVLTQSRMLADVIRIDMYFRSKYPMSKFLQSCRKPCGEWKYAYFKNPR